MADRLEVDELKIEASTERVLASRWFISSPNLSKFLRYIVDMKLAGKEAEIKGYSIAVDALGRPESFDAKNDPAVRIFAGRMRNALTDYYNNEGSGDPVHIHLPKGHYVPQFLNNEIEQRQELPAQTSSVELSSSRPKNIWKTLAIVFGVLAVGMGYFAFIVPESGGGIVDDPAVANRSIAIMVSEGADAQENQFANENSKQFVQELRAALSHNEALSILLPREQIDSQTRQAFETDDVDFVIKATDRNTENNRRVSVELVNSRTNVLVWARSTNINSDIKPPPSSEEIVTQIVRELSSQVFGASLKALEGRDPKTLSAKQLFVLATWVPGPAKNSLKWEKERIELARLSIQRFPDFGPAYSVLADKLAYLAAVDGPSDSNDALAEADISSLRALELSPGDANTVFNIAQSQWHSGAVKASIRSMNRVLELDPSHAFARFFSTVYPFTCIAAPDDVLDSALSFDQSLGPDNPIRWVTLTWLGWLHLNRSEFELALEAEQQAAQIFQIPYTVMRHAAILNQLNRVEEAAKIIAVQKINWPNIDPAHFSSVAVPRLCQNFSNSQKMVGFYESLTRGVSTQLGR